MASTAGRALRVIVGVAILAIGSVVALQWWLIALGVFFIAVGLLDVCIFGPLVGKSFSGKKLREQVK